MFSDSLSLIADIYCVNAQIHQMFQMPKMKSQILWNSRKKGCEVKFDCISKPNKKGI